MTQSPLGLYANLTLCIFSIAIVVKWQPSNLAQTIENSATAEYLLKLCGAVEAGLNNLSDTVQTIPADDKQRLSKGLEFIQERIRQLQDELKLPNNEACRVQGLVRQYQAQTYRLNHVDQPTRLINWSSRITSSPEQI